MNNSKKVFIALGVAALILATGLFSYVVQQNWSAPEQAEQVGEGEGEGQ